MTTGDETAGEGRTAARPVWNDNSLVVSGRRLNKKKLQRKKDASTRERGRWKDGSGEGAGWERKGRGRCSRVGEGATRSRLD